MTVTSPSAWLPAQRPARENAAERILLDLKDAILAGRLARGTKLPTEKQLAETYGVSGPTVREAVRGLITAQLIEVRHGSGAYVTAYPDQLVAASLNPMIQLERIGVPDLLNVLGVLNAYAAELAATKASDADIARMHEALAEVQSATSAEAVSTALTAFLDALGRAGGNPLLAALCRFLSGLQVGIAKELAGGSLQTWRDITGRLASERKAIADAIGSHDADAARAAARNYHQKSLAVVTALPQADSASVSDAAKPELG